MIVVIIIILEKFVEEIKTVFFINEKNSRRILTSKLIINIVIEDRLINFLNTRFFIISIFYINLDYYGAIS